MKAIGIAAVALIMLLVTSVTPAAAAKGSAPQGGPSGSNPSQACVDNNILVEFAPSEIFPMEIASHGGCVSTVAAHGYVVQPGDYSQAAYVAQCKLLKSELPPELWNAPVIIVDTAEGPSNIGGFGGKVETCTELLRAYHSGTLTHPE